MRNGQDLVQRGPFQAKPCFSHGILPADCRRRAEGLRQRVSPVKRAFHLLDEFRHIVESNSRLELAEIAYLYLERFLLGGTALARQSMPQRLVDDVSEGAPRATRFCLELGCNVVVKC